MMSKYWLRFFSASPPGRNVAFTLAVLIQLPLPVQIAVEQAAADKETSPFLIYHYN